jgi:hypothetical protein
MTAADLYQSMAQLVLNSIPGGWIGRLIVLLLVVMAGALLILWAEQQERHAKR